MCKNVVPLKVGPKAPTFAYPGTKPVNQSLVTQTDGITYFLQQYSRQALLKMEIYRVVIAAFASGYGNGKISEWCKKTTLTPETSPSCTPRVYS